MQNQGTAISAKASPDGMVKSARPGSSIEIDNAPQAFSPAMTQIMCKNDAI